MKPWPMSQISSSWRRTLRWLRAKPPGRSDAASRSLMIQQKRTRLEPLGPASLHATRLRVDARPSPEQPQRVGRRARRRARARSRAPWSTAHTAVASVPSSRVVDGVVAEHSAPRNDLRDGADEHRHVDALDQLAEAREQLEVVRDGLAEPDAGIGAQRVGRDAGGARRGEALDAGSRRPRRRRRRSAGRAASCAARPACASHEPGAARRRPAEHLRVGDRRRRR